MMKPDSLYNAGMKPLMYSNKQAKHKCIPFILYLILEIGWYRNGYDICYYQNNMKRKNNGYYYTLTLAFKLNCKYTNPR